MVEVLALTHKLMSTSQLEAKWLSRSPGNFEPGCSFGPSGILHCLAPGRHHTKWHEILNAEMFYSFFNQMFKWQVKINLQHLWHYTCYVTLVCDMTRAYVLLYSTKCKLLYSTCCTDIGLLNGHNSIWNVYEIIYRLGTCYICATHWLTANYLCLQNVVK